MKPKIEGTLPAKRAGAKVVSFINMKGGVGKTTSSVTLAETCAAEFGWTVLFLDLDAQASASYALLGAERFERQVEEERTLAAYFDRIAEGRRPEPLTAYAARADIADGKAGHIDVVPAEPALRYAERALIEHYHGLSKSGAVSRKGADGQTRRILRDALTRAGRRYDLVIIDCPPGVSIFAEAGVACSDLIVIPTIPDYLSTLGLRELNKRFLKQMRRDGNLKGGLAILPSKVRAGDATHRKFLAQLDAMVRDGEIDATLFATQAPQDAAIARALEPEHLGQSFAKKYGKAADDLRALALEMTARLEAPLTAAAEAAEAPKTARKSAPAKRRRAAKTVEIAPSAPVAPADDLIDFAASARMIDPDGGNAADAVATSGASRDAAEEKPKRRRPATPRKRAPRKTVDKPTDVVEKARAPAGASIRSSAPDGDVAAEVNAQVSADGSADASAEINAEAKAGTASGPVRAAFAAPRREPAASDAASAETDPAEPSTSSATSPHETSDERRDQETGRRGGFFARFRRRSA